MNKLRKECIDFFSGLANNPEINVEAAGIELAAVWNKAGEVSLNLKGDLRRHQPLLCAQIIGEALKHNSSITRLDLSFNNLGNKGVKALINGLESNTISSLIVSINGITDEGAFALASGVLRNSTLSHLDLSSNSISNKGAKSFFDALTKNQSMMLFSLRDNSISNESEIRVQSKVSDNRADYRQALAYVFCHKDSPFNGLCHNLMSVIIPLVIRPLIKYGQPRTKSNINQFWKKKLAMNVESSSLVTSENDAEATLSIIAN